MNLAWKVSGTGASPDWVLAVVLQQEPQTYVDVAYVGMYVGMLFLLFGPASSIA